MRCSRHYYPSCSSLADLTAVGHRREPNPNSPKFAWVDADEQLQGKEKRYDPNNWRFKLQIANPCFKLVNLALLMLVMTPFIQW